MLNVEPSVFNKTGINIECKSKVCPITGPEGPEGE
jgi:hypothetical protein